MHRVNVGMKGWLGLLAAIAALVVMVAVLPLFGNTAYVAGTISCPKNAQGTPTGPNDPTCNLNNTVQLALFNTPGGPVARTTAGVDATTQTFDLMVNDALAFPSTCPPTAPNRCQILVTDPGGAGFFNSAKSGAEIMSYDTRTATSFHIVERQTGKLCPTPTPTGPTPTGPGCFKKGHASGSLVALATTLAATTAAGDGPQTTLTSAITGTAGNCTPPPPTGGGFTCPDPLAAAQAFKITVGNAAALTAVCMANCAISIGHQDVQTSNQLSGQGGEVMVYNNDPPLPSGCGTLGTNQLCIVRRGVGSSNKAYPHKADGYTQPGPKPAPSGRSKVSLHFQMAVKSNAGFFPTSTLLVCDPTNPAPTNCELIGYDNQMTKIKTPSSTEFHATGRCGTASEYQKSCTTPGTHAAGSIVVGATNQIVCRTAAKQPGVSPPPGGFPATDLDGNPTQAGTSVGLTAVCYTREQPKGPPKTSNPKQLLVPLAGQDLIIFNALGQPFLSTGGFNHIFLGAVPYVDANGTHDGILKLVTPCLPDFSPGTNLQVTASLSVNKAFGSTWMGTVRLIVDTIHDNTPNNGDECNDPASTDIVSFTAYDYPGVAPCPAGANPGKGCIDTDGDGCQDLHELQGGDSRALGGLRDPWNKFDFYDIDGNKQVTLFGDIFGVANAFNQGPGGPQYTAAKDRGATYGPFPHNLSEPDNIITLFGDIFSVAAQFNDNCTGTVP